MRFWLGADVGTVLHLPEEFVENFRNFASSLTSRVGDGRTIGRTFVMALARAVTKLLTKGQYMYTGIQGMSVLHPKLGELCSPRNPQWEASNPTDKGVYQRAANILSDYVQGLQGNAFWLEPRAAPAPPADKEDPEVVMGIPV